MRAPPLDLRLLEVFEAIFVEKSLTNAALKLDMTQPAVSQSLTRMRTHFGDTLFVRAPGGMEPTPRAKELFASVAVIQIRWCDGASARNEPGFFRLPR